MTLERVTERLQEEKDKVGKVDGRRFNSRSHTKMKWEIRNIEKSIRIAARKKISGTTRSTYTKEELEEYRAINNNFREEMRTKRDAKKEAEKQLSEKKESEDASEDTSEDMSS